jgi:hypothetical protein
MNGRKFQTILFLCFASVDEPYCLADRVIHSVSRRNPVTVKHIMPQSPAPSRAGWESQKRPKGESEIRGNAHRKLKKG